MRAAFVLALLFCIVTPPGVLQTAAETDPGKGASAAAMSSPAGALCQLVRDSAKVEKTFSGGAFAALDHATAFPLVDDSHHASAHAPLLRAVAIDVPPLAPRPPPAA